MRHNEPFVDVKRFILSTLLRCVIDDLNRRTLPVQ